MTATRRHPRRPPPLRALLPRPLRRQPGRRRLPLGLFGDVATEMCIRTDGDEGLFASYSDVQFRAPVRAGDVLEITCELVRVGTRSRVMDFTRARRGARRARPPTAPGAAADARPSRSWPPPRPAPSSSRRAEPSH